MVHAVGTGRSSRVRGRLRRVTGRAAVAWFRRDLRLSENPAWTDACASADRVVALFVLDPALYDAAGPHRRDQRLACHVAAERALHEPRLGTEDTTAIDVDLELFQVEDLFDRH